MFERIDEFPKLPVALPRFCIYVDGYNFYGAINHADPEWLYGLGWCNFHKLGEELVSKTFNVPQKWFDLRSKYFTTEVPDWAFRERARQDLWLEALKPQLTDTPILGKWRILTGEEREKKGKSREEKKTDVNIAIHITRDVLEFKPAGIMLISGDSDFEPLVDFAASHGVAVAAFNPQEHHNPYLRPKTHYANKIHFDYLTRDVLETCGMERGALWEKHFELKVRDHPDFNRAYEYAKNRK